jgi:hypothetical protein
MKTALRLAGLALIALGSVNGHQLEFNEGFKLKLDIGEKINLSQQQQQLEVFKIDLDLPPKQRFMAPTKRFRN